MSNPTDSGAESESEVLQIETPERTELPDRATIWRCDCGHEEPRYGDSKGVKFCEPCEWQFGVLCPMQPVRRVDRVIPQ